MSLSTLITVSLKFSLLSTLLLLLPSSLGIFCWTLLFMLEISLRRFEILSSLFIVKNAFKLCMNSRICWPAGLTHQVASGERYMARSRFSLWNGLVYVEKEPLLSWSWAKTWWLVFSSQVGRKAGRRGAAHRVVGTWTSIDQPSFNLVPRPTLFCTWFS